MNIFFNTFYFCSFFLKGLAYGPGLKLGPRLGPPRNGLGPGELGPGFSLSGQAGPKAGRGLFGDPWTKTKKKHYILWHCHMVTYHSMNTINYINTYISYNILWIIGKFNKT